MTRRDFDGEPGAARLARLIAATRATADPAVLARARARILADGADRSRVPALALWLARPAVLAGAGVLCALCLAGTFAISQRAGAATATGQPSLLSSLVGEEDLGLPIETGTAAGVATGDSGEVAR